MMKKVRRNDVKIGLALAGMFSLGFAVSRCSPLAQSLSKTAFGSESPGGGLTQTLQPTLAMYFQFEAEVRSVFDTETDDTIVTDPRQEKKMIGLDEIAIQEFRATGRIRVNLADAAQFDSAKFIFRVNLSKREVRSRRLERFKLDVRPLRTAEILIAVRAGVDATVLDTIQNELESIEVVLTRTRPTPGPSPILDAATETEISSSLDR